MRLWHYRLIPYLPREMLVSEWRECIAIKRQWEKGSLKHRLVSYVMDYDKGLFNNYTKSIVEEMVKRHLKVKISYYIEINDFCCGKTIHNNYPEHNDRYLKQCLYNLQEKFDRGIITKKEWDEIENHFQIDVDT